MAELTEMPFGMQIRAEIRKYTLDEGPDPYT